MLLFQKWLEAGLTPEMPEDSRRRVMLASRLSVACAIVTVGGIPADYPAGGMPLVLFDVCFFLFFAGIILACRTRHQRIAKRIFVAGANLGITINLLMMGKVSGVQYICFPLLTLPIAVIAPKYRRTQLFFIVFPVALFFATDSGLLDPYVLLKHSQLERGEPYWFSIGSSFVMLLVALRHFERVHSEDAKQLLAQQAKLTQAANMSTVGQMAAGIAHEMNNPLAVIQFKTEKARRLLLAENPNQEIVVCLDRIVEMVSRMSTIIRSLRVVARDSTKEEPTHFAVESAFSTALDLCGDRFRTHGIRLELTAAVEKDSTIFARPIQVSQVLINLLTNAFDALEKAPEKWIRLEAKEDDEFVELAVVDSGPGITAEKRTQIFDPFYTTKEVGHGTGLGLSISSALAFSNGGSLTLDNSSPNTRFVLKLPKREGGRLTSPLRKAA